jgi:hypothetical protein
MDTRQLHERLEHLQRELEQIEPADERERAVLLQATADIRDLLAGTEAPTPESYERLGELLKARVAEVEAAYPRATLVLGRVIDTLAGLGL